MTSTDIAILRRLVVALVAVLAGSVGSVAACTCVLAPPAKDEFKAADAVFVGRVISYGGDRAWLTVLRTFKGADVPEIMITSSADGAACGYGWKFSVGSEHLIYAFAGRDGSLSTQICDRTGRVADRACDLRYLERRASWWRSSLSSIRILKWLGVRHDPCVVVPI